MIQSFFQSFVSWEAIAIYILAGAGAIAWFFPPFRRIALQIGAFVAGLLFIYSKGKRDGTRKTRKEWDAAERRTRETALEARRRAERDAAAGQLRDPRDRDDI